MPLYRVAFASRAGINTANSAIANLWSQTRRIRVREVAAYIRTAPSNAPVFALQRSTVRGTQTTTLAPIPMNPQDIAATASLDTIWSANPTFSSADPQIAVGAVPNAIGNGSIFIFDTPLEVAIAAGLTLFNIPASGATLGAFTGHFVYEE